MLVCVICRFEVALDDVVALTASSRCICLRCFTRETDTFLPMPKNLRRAVASVVEAPSIEEIP